MSLFILTKSLLCLAEADQKLMMAIIATHSITINFAAVAEHMGNVCTPRAVQERLKKIKKTGAGAGEVNSTPATPKGKRGKPTPTHIFDPRAKPTLGPKAKPNAKPERQKGKAIQPTKVEDSDAGTDLLTDLGSDFDNLTEIENGDDDENDATRTEDGKIKNGKAKPKATPKPKAPGKSEPKPAKASSASGATKSKKAASTTKANGNASPNKANQGTKRKREDGDEDKDDGVKSEEEEGS